MALKPNGIVWEDLSDKLKQQLQNIVGPGGGGGTVFDPELGDLPPEDDSDFPELGDLPPSS